MEGQHCGHHALANTMAHLQENLGPNPCNGSVIGCDRSFVLLLSLGHTMANMKMIWNALG